MQNIFKVYQDNLVT